jgi:hypothetical protein
MPQQLGYGDHPCGTINYKRAMQFVRAVLDFIILAKYRAHDIDTLNYLN